MHHLAKVTLENEMDLVLAHKRSMKLAEIAGLSLAAQTTFATAVSEVSRNTIEHGKNGCLTLGVSEDKKRSIIACIKDDNINNKDYKQGLEYAKKLVDRLNILSQSDETSIELYYNLSTSENIDLKKLDEWRSIFRNEPPISPYDEIKRKNEQLQELAQKLKESEDHYKDLTDTLPVMMFSLNEEGDLSYINKWMSEYLGRNAEDLKNLEHEDIWDKEDKPVGTMKQLIGKKEPILAEWRIKNRQGDPIWHMAAIHPSFHANKPEQWFGFLVDIHARKLFEQTLKDNEELKNTQQLLQQKIKELNRSNEELQQFAFIASHDLQEPLRKILFYCDYIGNVQRNNLEERSRQYLQNMISAASRMRSMVNDLLEFSQVEHRRLNIQSVDLSAVMQRAITTYEMTIKEKAASVVYTDLPTIFCDEAMIQRLFENLLSNSLKYSKEDIAPVIEISGNDNGSEIEILFKDNGIGFEEQFSTQVFGIFQRLHSKEEYKGTGIGLAICRKIVEMHGGSIKVHSSSGDGATFVIRIPKHQTHAS